LIKAQKDIKFEIARRDEEIRRFKADMESLQEHLRNETKSKEDEQQQVRLLNETLDVERQKMARLIEDMSKLEEELKESVPKNQWDLLELNHMQLKQQMNEIIAEKEKQLNEMKTMEHEKKELMEQVEKMKTEISGKEEEISKLESYQNFWRNRANSIQRELHRLLNETKPGGSKDSFNGNHPHVQKQLERKKELEKEVKKLLEEKKTAETVVGTYRRAFEDEMSKHKHDIFRRSLFKVRNRENVKSCLKKNQQLHMLANELADTVIDREENVKHLKEVKKLLGMRVKQVEEENNSFRQKLGLPTLEPQGLEFLKKWNSRSKKNNTLMTPAEDAIILSSISAATNSSAPPSDVLFEDGNESDKTKNSTQKEESEQT